MERQTRARPPTATTAAVVEMAGGQCPDCGMEFVGPYCHGCGHPPMRRLPGLGAFLKESFEALFDFDGRWWRSFRRLWTEPGRMGRQYIAGRRGSIVHPAKLFAVAAVSVVAVAEVTPSHARGTMYSLTMDIGAGMGGDRAAWVFGLTSIPLMALALKLLYPWRRYRYLEHLVVTILFFSLVLFIATLEKLVVTAAGGTIGVGDRAGYLAAVSGFLYGYAILRQAYGSGIAGAFLRVVGLIAVYGLATTAAFDLLARIALRF